MSAKRKKNPVAQYLGHLGGTARTKNFTPEQLSEFARRAGLARNKKISPAERRRIAMLGVKARQAKRKLKNAEEK